MAFDAFVWSSTYLSFSQSQFSGNFAASLSRPVRGLPPGISAWLAVLSGRQARPPPSDLRCPLPAPSLASSGCRSRTRQAYGGALAVVETADHSSVDLRISKSNFTGNYISSSSPKVVRERCWGRL